MIEIHEFTTDMSTSLHAVTCLSCLKKLGRVLGILIINFYIIHVISTTVKCLFLSLKCFGYICHVCGLMVCVGVPDLKN